jgi:hypothetical protein
MLSFVACSPYRAQEMIVNMGRSLFPHRRPSNGLLTESLISCMFNDRQQRSIDNRVNLLGALLQLVLFRSIRMSLSLQRNIMGMVVAVMCDSYGAFMRASVNWLPVVQLALLAEAKACRADLQLLTATVDVKVILETDSKILVELLNSQSVDRSEVATILADIPEL